MSSCIYLSLTRAFNRGRLRAILGGGQAVVLHRLALMSKDGDWILREDEECVGHILAILEAHGASYRFGAPLDLRWLVAGWSSHLEFRHEGLRVRTDFVTRPPRLPAGRLADLWREQEGRDPPYLDVADLIETKRTNREKDYVVIGELARLAENPEDQLKSSRSARDILQLLEAHPGLFARLETVRPALASARRGRAALEAALDAERRRSIHANEARLARYMEAAGRWAQAWPELSQSWKGKPLSRAHAQVVAGALRLLPTQIPGLLP